MKVAQEPARHSDPKLTMNVYAELGIYDLAGALDALPGVSRTDERDALHATGTYNARVGAPTDPRLYSRQLGREGMRSGATSCENKPSDGALVCRRQTPKIAESSE